MTVAPAASVLFVCTANECRSPFAEALARRRAAGLPLEVSSAGITAWRRPVPDTGRRVAHEYGLDLDRHVSRPVHADFLAEYDLVLGLSRSHLRELAVLAPELGTRLFTLRGFARWAVGHPRRPGEPVASWLASAGRPVDRFASRDTDDDVADPLGRPADEWRAMAELLTTSIDGAVYGLYPQGPVELSRRPPAAPWLSPSAP